MSLSEEPADTDPPLTSEAARQQTQAIAAELAALIEGTRRAMRDGIQEILAAAPDWAPQRNLRHKRDPQPTDSHRADDPSPDGTDPASNAS
jgi:hypothetical protein